MVTNKERLEANNEKIKAIQESLNRKILSANKEYIDLAKQMIDGTLEEFDNKKIGVTSITPYMFYKFQNLKKVDLTGITDISYRVCNNCTNLTNLILDENTTQVQENSFIGCSAISNDLNFKTPCTIGQYAFDGAGITGLTGKFLDIGAYAFQNCNKLTNFDVTINGSLSTYTFAYLYYVDNFNISKESDITSLNSGTFRGIGGKRETPENNVLELDFLNSTFESVPYYALAGNGSSTMNSYMNIYLPNSVKSLGNYALGYSDHINIYFTSTTPPTITTSSFYNNTNYKIFVPYNVVNAYRTATNWSTIVDYIYAYTDKDYFEQGDKLPKYLIEGFELTWYSDKEFTNQVTTVENPSQHYYCVVGKEQLDVVIINDIWSEDCDIVVEDNNGNQYSKGDILLAGTQLTITVTPTIDGHVPYIQRLNGEDFTSPYSYTTISGENITIGASYYNGVDIPANPDFAQNSWAIIKEVVQRGSAGAYWSVGDIKEIEIDGLTYGIRLSDLQSGRYDYANSDRKTNAVFEFVELLNDSYKINTTAINEGGWAECSLKKSLNTKVLDKIPMELSGFLEEVVVKSADTGKSTYTITTSNNKLFIPCAEEVGVDVNSFGRTGEGTLWDYYENSTDSTRIKMKPNTTSGIGWWLRSPYPGRDNTFSLINQTGVVPTGYYYSHNPPQGVCPCFAW